MQFTIHKNAYEPGSDKWFETIYNNHFEGLLRYAFSIAEDKATAEDVVSEVFISLWNRKDQLDEINNVEAYLVQSVKHLTIKKIKKSRTETLGPIDESKYPQALNPENILIGKELESVINQVVQSLTPYGKLVYDMARNKGYSNEKIAKELDMNQATVRKHLSNVIKAFKTALKNQQESEEGKIIKLGKALLITALILSGILSFV